MKVVGLTGPNSRTFISHLISCSIIAFDCSTGSGAARPVIPKRGEKDFEPAQGVGSGLQHHNLERARSAMFDALRSTRTVSRCVHPSIPECVRYRPSTHIASLSATEFGTQTLPARM